MAKIGKPAPLIKPSPMKKGTWPPPGKKKAKNKSLFFCESPQEKNSKT